MKLIVGLGNPGKDYIDSRHNAGFSAVKALAHLYKSALKRDESVFSLVGKTRISKETLVLALPLTFMNLSGIAVRALCKKFKIGREDLLVVCDDLDLEFGRLKLRAEGSSAGHRGIQSVIDALRESSFARLRVGIGRPKGRLDPADYVLSGFSKKERGLFKIHLESIIACCESWALKGINETMNIFNRRSSQG